MIYKFNSYFAPGGTERNEKNRLIMVPFQKRLIPTKDLNEAVGGALTMRKGYVRQGQRK
jgi:hypothetical protein